VKIVLYSCVVIQSVCLQKVNNIQAVVVVSSCQSYRRTQRIGAMSIVLEVPWEV